MKYQHILTLVHIQPPQKYWNFPSLSASTQICYPDNMLYLSLREKAWTKTYSWSHLIIVYRNKLIWMKDILFLMWVNKSFYHNSLTKLRLLWHILVGVMSPLSVVFKTSKKPNSTGGNELELFYVGLHIPVTGKS